MANRDAVGRSSATAVMDVERGKIREFARATGSRNRCYLEAQQPVAPPTFLATQLLWQGDEPDLLQSAEVDLQRGLHAEQEYVFHGPPPRAGDRLTFTTTIADMYEKRGRRGGAMTFTVMVTEFWDASGRLVAEARNTVVETSSVAEAAQ
jgi:N-terminal half of MaoC dehydratase